MMTWEGFFSPRNQGKKTFYDKDGKVIQLNELDRNLQEGITPEKPTMIAYANGVHTDAPEEVLPSAIREAKDRKTRAVVKLPEAEEADTSDGDMEVSEEKTNRKTDAGLSGKLLPANIDTNVPAGVPADSISPWQHALDALGVASKNVYLTSTAAGNENSTSESYSIMDKSTSKEIGSCVMTPTGCEAIMGDRKIVAYQLNDSDMYMETYAKNDEGDLKLQKKVRIGDNDGITVTRPWTGLA
jgi:hypothetical protein